jgi:cell wall-associated NlpC family hydrolase
MAYGLTERFERKLVVEIAKSYQGTWYRWGGDDPAGFDCSGLAIECLKSVGKLPRGGDWTASGLSRLFPVTQNPLEGDLVFWQNRIGKIIHIEVMINNELAIGASGGGSKTLTIQDAIKHNAYIKIRPVSGRPNIWGYCDPWAETKEEG